MDTQARHALKKDKFAQAAATSASWLTENRSSLTRWVVSGAVALVLVVGALIYWSVRSVAADSALGAAVDVYNAPLALPGAPAQPGVYATSADRAKEANRQFVAVAHDFGWLPQGAKARYFAGITYEELGQNGSAETELKSAASSWSRNVGNLARLALAGLYQQTARSDQAIALYNEIVAHPSETVTAATAQLALADLYEAQGKTEQARQLWAKVKDADKDGAAGSIAAQHLAVKQ